MQREVVNNKLLHNLFFYLIKAEMNRLTFRSFFDIIDT